MWPFGTTTTTAKDQDRPAAPPPPPPSNTIAAAPVIDTPAAEPPRQARWSTPTYSERSLRQLGLFAAGATFLGLSTMITRRAIARKYVAGIPRFYEQSNNKAPKIGGDGGLVAVEALSLATLNVIGFGIMLTGGLSWAFDVSDIEDLRTMARKHTRPGPGGETDEEAERQFTEWANDILEKFGQKVDLDAIKKKENDGK